MDWKNASNKEIVCYCQNVDKETIVTAIKSGDITLDMIRKSTTACSGGNCKELNPSGKCCSKDIQEIINLYT